jgi:hypothetical protein
MWSMRRELAVSLRGWLLAALASAFILAYSLVNVATAACLNLAVGGVAGFPALAQPNVAASFRACRPKLYIHDYSWTRQPVDVRTHILANFPGPADVELGLNNTPEKYFAGTFKQQYLDNGVKLAAAHVNGFRPDRLDVWARFVTAAKSVGFTSVSPIATPNGGQWKDAPFSSSTWDWIRVGAKQGGGLTVDCPSGFFLHQPAGYKKFIQDEIQWARQNHLHAAFIFSPGPKGDDSFAEDTVEVFKVLKSMDASPDEYIVENYEPTPRADYKNDVGTAEMKQSVLGVARNLSDTANGGRM